MVLVGRVQRRARGGPDPTDGHAPHQQGAGLAAPVGQVAQGVVHGRAEQSPGAGRGPRRTRPSRPRPTAAGSRASTASSPALSTTGRSAARVPGSGGRPIGHGHGTVILAECSSRNECFDPRLWSVVGRAVGRVRGHGPAAAPRLVRQRQRLRRPSRRAGRAGGGQPGPRPGLRCRRLDGPGARRRPRSLFGVPAEVAFTWGGTGANVVGLQCLLAPWQAVICPDTAHIHVDECGAPERFTGAKLIDVPTPDGKLRPEQVLEQVHLLGDMHHVQPRVVSITQSTEQGSLYQPDEVAALAEVAHRHGMVLHMDGARLANAAAALGGDVRVLHRRRRRRRAHLRRHQERHGLRRGGGLPGARAGGRRGLRAQAGRPAPVQDALRGRPVRGPAGRRPVAAQRRPRQRHGPAAGRAGGGHRRRDGHPAPRGQRRVRHRAPRRAGPAAGLVALLRVGRGHHRGAVDDQLRHHRSTTSSGSRPGWRHSSSSTPASDQASSMRSSDSVALVRSRSATPATSTSTSASAPT